MVAKYLTDEQWASVAPVVSGKKGDPGCHGRDNRLFLEAVFWVARTNARWRSLPPEFGKWYTTYTRYRRWEQKGVWPKVIAALQAHDGRCDFSFDPVEGLRWTPTSAGGGEGRGPMSCAAA